MAPAQVRRWAMVACAALVSLAPGCSDRADTEGRARRSDAPPTSAEQCEYRRTSDTGSPLGHWSDTTDHGYDEVVEIYFCHIEPANADLGVLDVSAPHGTTVSPTSARFEPDGNGVLRFEVRVQPGAYGHVVGTLTLDERIQDARQLPPITAYATRWTFDDD